MAMQSPTASADTKVITGKVRFSYVHVFEPHAVEPGQDPKFSVCLLIPKSDTATVSKIKAAIEAAKTAGLSKWGGKVPPNLKLPLRDGDTERDTTERPEYAGHYFVNANSKTRPGIVDANLLEILDPGELYSGCYGRASINFYAFNTAGNRGIACGLNNLQKLSDGEFLGGRSRPEDDFEPADAMAAQSAGGILD